VYDVGVDDGSGGIDIGFIAGSVPFGLEFVESTFVAGVYSGRSLHGYDEYCGWIGVGSVG